MTTLHTNSIISPGIMIKRKHQVIRGGVAKVSNRQTVRKAETLAFADKPSEYKLLDVSAMFDITPAEADRLVRFQEDDHLAEGEEIASVKSFLNLNNKTLTAPLEGDIIRKTRGKLLIAGDKERTFVSTVVPGLVTEVEPYEYVVVETACALVQVAWADGEAAWGTIKLVSQIPDVTTETGETAIGYGGSIVVLREPLTKEFLLWCAANSVRAIVTPSMRASLVPTVQATGLPVAITQAFGTVLLGQLYYDVFDRYNGREAAYVPGDSRYRKPEIIIPIEASMATDRESDFKLELEVGGRVRVMQRPYWGQLGTVREFAMQPEVTNSGLMLAGAFVKLDGSKTIFVPYINLEVVAQGQRQP